jgi:protein-S-isoprenylcysteine O-methyltransferase Ste14
MGNAAGTSFCRLCKSAAIALPAEVEAARHTTVESSSAARPPQTQWSPPTSPVLRAVWYLSVAVMIVGALLARIAPPLWLNWAGLGIALLGGACVCVVEYASKGSHA